MIFAGNVTFFGNKGFTDWKNAIGVKRSSLKLHEESKDRIDAAEASKDFLAVCEDAKSDIYSSLSKIYEEQVAKNRTILISIIDVIAVLGQRNIALCGNWDKELKNEDGNFQFFIDWKSSFDSVLKEHLETAS